MIPDWRRQFQWTPGTPVTRSDGTPWPIRNPALWEARCGDVFAGNLELATRCSHCGRSGIVDVATIAARYEPMEDLRPIVKRVFCRECEKTLIVSLHYPRAPHLDGH